MWHRNKTYRINTYNPKITIQIQFHSPSAEAVSVQKLVGFLTHTITQKRWFGSILRRQVRILRTQLFYKLYGTSIRCKWTKKR
jgi:hypothetical protein